VFYRKEVYMICENCRIYSEMFGPICSVCGSEMEYVPKTKEPTKPYSSPTEILVEEKILTNSETNKNRAGKRVRLQWLVLLGKFLKICMAKIKIVYGGMR